MDPDPRVGRELAGYRIERVLGRGGMSIVYLAEHLRLHRKVALKVLSPELSEDEAFRTRFIRESEAAASLDHPNIIPIFEAGEVGTVLYIAMRYVKTTDLAVLVAEEGPLDPHRVVSIIEQAASALDSAHVEGLVHRDVKPANLLIATHAGPGGADHVYLSDFGLTKRQATKSGLTRTGSFMGTLDYVPPEQIKGEELDGRSDQYALACVLFQCLTGRVPFDRDDEATVLFAHLSEPPPSATEHRPDLPASIDAVIARGMAKEPDERYATCSDLAESARKAVQAPAVATLPIAPAPTVVASAGAANAGAAETTVAPTPQGETTEAPAPDSGEGVLPPAVPAPPQGPPPDGARRRQRALIVGGVGALVVIVLLFVLVPLGGEGTPNEGAVTGATADEVSPTEDGSGSAVNPLVGKWEVTDPAGGLVQLTIERSGDVLLTVERESLQCSPPGFFSLQGTGEFRRRQDRDQLVLTDLVADCRLDSEPPQTIQEPNIKPNIIVEHDPVADQVINPEDRDFPALDRVEEFTVNPLVGTWEVDDAQLTIEKDGTIQLVDDSSSACSPPGLIVVDEVGQFRTRRGRDQLVVSDAFADCRQGSGDDTIPEFIIEHEPETDRVRTGSGPFTGIAFERV
jgi:Protein kinase domain